MRISTPPVVGHATEREIAALREVEASLRSLVTALGEAQRRGFSAMNVKDLERMASAWLEHVEDAREAAPIGAGSAEVRA